MRQDGQVTITISRGARDWLRAQAARDGVSIVQWVENLASGPVTPRAVSERVLEMSRRAVLPVESMTWDAGGNLTSHTFPLAEAEAGTAPPAVATAGEYVPPVAATVYEPVPAAVVKACACGGRNGVPAPYREQSRRRQTTCPFYAMGVE